MAGFAPDTSYMIAAVCAWHTHHERVVTDLERRLARRESMIVAAPALVEAYAVLTRLPPPHRLAPTDALTLLDVNFLRLGRLVALRGADYAALLRAAPADGVSGGRTYDAVILQCAVAGRASALLTFNVAHFAPLAGERLDVVAP